MHNNDIIHMDISPNNIVLGKDGNYKFIDFGCSKNLDNVQNTITIAGKCPFMAPELIKWWDEQ